MILTEYPAAIAVLGTTSSPPLPNDPWLDDEATAPWQVA